MQELVANITNNGYFQGYYQCYKVFHISDASIAHPGMEVNDKNGYFPRYFVKGEFKLMGSRAR